MQPGRPLPQVYGYNIPANMYAAASLDRALWLNQRLWGCPSIQQQATKLAGDIRTGGLKNAK